MPRHAVKFAEGEQTEFDAMGPRAVSSHGDEKPQSALVTSNLFGGIKKDTPPQEELRAPSRQRLVGTGEVERIGSSYGMPQRQKSDLHGPLKKTNSNYFGSAHQLATGEAPPRPVVSHNTSPQPASELPRKNVSSFSDRRGSTMPTDPRDLLPPSVDPTGLLAQQALGHHRRQSVNDKSAELLMKQDLLRRESARPGTRNGEDETRPGTRTGQDETRPGTRTGVSDDDDPVRPQTNNGNQHRPLTNGGLRPGTNGGQRPGTSSMDGQRPGTNSGPRPGTNAGLVASDGTINLAPANPFNRPKTQETLDRLGTAASRSGAPPSSNGRLGDNSAEILEGRRAKMQGRAQDQKKKSTECDNEKEKSDDEAVCCF
jgi:hypothetical protein